MARILIIFLGLLFVYAQSFAQMTYSGTYTQRAPVAQFPQCGYDYNCFYQQLSLQNQQEKQSEKEEARINQQNTFQLEEARLGEMEKQTQAMEQQNELSTFQDDKIEAQEEEIQSQREEIDQLNETIDKLNSQIEDQKNIQTLNQNLNQNNQDQTRSDNLNQRTDSSSSSAESQ